MGIIQYSFTGDYFGSIEIAMKEEKREDKSSFVLYARSEEDLSSITHKVIGGLMFHIYREVDSLYSLYPNLFVK